MIQEEGADRSTHVCPAEHAGWLTIAGRRLVNNPKRILKGLVHAGDVVIDLGCGPGFFTVPMAEMVGESGAVIAVDVQEEMLRRVRERAEAAGVTSRIRFHHSRPDGPGLVGPADFALAFWMLHEVPNKATFLRQVHDSLAGTGRFLLVEPRGHVSKARFEEAISQAQSAGFMLEARPRVGLSRAALFRRGGSS